MSLKNQSAPSGESGEPVSRSAGSSTPAAGQSAPLGQAPILPGNRAPISIFQMVIMTTITVASLRSLPAMAVMGWSSVFLYLIPALLFFIPSALVSAELGATYEGGVYDWVKAGLGERWGLTAVWMQWVHNIVWYPAQLAMVAATALYIVDLGRDADSGLYTAIVIVVVFWWAVWVALRGGNFFAKISAWTGLLGTIIPVAILLVLGVVWLATDQPRAPILAQTSFLPHFSGFASIALVVSTVLSFAGMEVNAVHASHLKDPKRGYTHVIWIAVVAVLAIFIVPTLVMAMVAPGLQDHLTNGAIFVFATAFNVFHMGWMGNVIALAIVLGALGSIVSWISGPSRGLYHAAKDDVLPAYFKKTNAAGAQEGILLIMGVLVTILAVLYLFFPDVNEVFLALTGMAVALYVCMYILMFVAAIRLRWQGKIGHDGYRAPGLYLFAGLGILACLAAFALTFVPAAGQTGIPPLVYPFLVGAVFILLGLPAFFLYEWAKRQRTKRQLAAAV